MRRAEDGVGIADALRAHMYRKWPTKDTTSTLMRLIDTNVYPDEIA